MGKTRRHEELGDFSTTVRTLPISGLAMIIGALCAFVALALLRLIGLFTNLFYYGRWSSALSSPAGNHLGLFSVLVPVGGALIMDPLSRKFLGLIALSDLLKARARHVEEERRREQVLNLSFFFPGSGVKDEMETPVTP